MFSREDFRFDRRRAVSGRERKMFIEASGQHGAGAKRQGRLPATIIFAFLENLVTDAEGNVHQAGGRFGRAVGREIGKEPPAGRRETDAQVRGPAFGETVLQGDVALVDVDAVMLPLSL
jgi:hypothetical protein